jgi:hypothetical protein
MDKDNKATEGDLDDLENLVRSCIESVGGDSEGEKAHRAKYARIGEWIVDARGGKDIAAKREEEKKAPVKKPAPPAKKAAAKKAAAKKPAPKDDLSDLE